MTPTEQAKQLVMLCRHAAPPYEGDPGACAECITYALISVRRLALEEAAKIADQHTKHHDLANIALCAEQIAQAIRALPETTRDRCGRD